MVKLPKKLIINVTAKNIKNGAYGLSSKCPVALAFKDQKYSNVVVGPYVVTILHKHKIIYYKISDKVRNFICDFDCRKSVKPFRFTAKLYE